MLGKLLELVGFLAFCAIAVGALRLFSKSIGE